MDRYVRKCSNVNTILFSFVFLSVIFSVCGIRNDWILYGNVFSLINWLALTLFFLVFNKKFFLSIFLFYVSQTFSIIFCFLIEYKAIYIYELGRCSYETGGTLFLTLFNTICMYVAVMVFRGGQENKDLHVKITKYKQKIVVALTFSMLIILLIGLCVYGSPIFMGIDRFKYWNTGFSSSILKIVFVNIDICVFLLGMIGKKYTRTAIIFLVLIAVFIGMYGEKFTKFYVCTYYYIFAYLAVNGTEIKKKTVLESIGVLVLIFCIIISIILYHYTYINIDLASGNVGFEEVILTRVASQGAVWWGIEEMMKFSENFSNLNVFFNEISNWFIYNPDIEYIGMYKLMDLLSMPEVVLYHMQQGSRFTMGYPAIGLYYFGYIGLFIFQIFTGSIIGIWAKNFYLYTRKMDIVMSIIFLKIGQLLMESFLMGNMYRLFSLKLILYLFLICCFYLYKNKYWINNVRV